jgi:uncharacterized membrane protein YuzA (DUF378 family)
LPANNKLCYRIFAFSNANKQEGDIDMKSLSIIDWVASILVVVGALNWGLVGFFQFNLVAAILGDMTFLARVVYGLVGIAAVYMIVFAIKIKKKSA